MLAWLALASTPSLAATACEPQGAAQLELRITPGEMAEAGKELSIVVHANDCVHIRMPDYYRRRGEYVLSLTGAERSRLDELQRAHQAQPFEHGRMLAEAWAIETRRSGEAQVERFAVLDADHYALTLRDDNRRGNTTRAFALFQYAERYPEIASLAALQRIAATLIELSEREDLIARSSSTRHPEAAP